MRVIPVSGRASRSMIVATLMCVATLAIAGCTSSGSAAGSPPTGGPAPTGIMKTEPGLQTCKLCGASSAPAAVEAAAVLADGVQVANVSIVEGVYRPNRITAQAGVPVRVVFTPSTPATGCVAMPTFESLGKSVSAKDGPGTLDLGSLEPGTYDLTCKMGSAGGELVVR